MIEASTKDRILDTAERLFAQAGLDAVSLRSITTAAGVNLAAVNYHFQSKEALVKAVIERRLGPMNRERMRMLDDFEAEAGGGPVPVRQILEAFLIPVFELKNSAAREFVPLIGRIYSERRSFMQDVFREHLYVIAKRFQAAFQRALPHLTPVEVMWRTHFLAGAMVHAIGGSALVSALSDGLCNPDDVAGLIPRMVVFFTAAFEAPVPEVQHAP